MFDHGLWPNELHVHLDLCKWQANLSVLVLGLKATLDAVVDESNEASSDDDTEVEVRYCSGICLYIVHLLRNI